jgi:DNA-directed RNA polymerase specialized sigma subunit
MNLVKERPHIVKRVPQHYIASYLGISSVHLSRIKSQLARKK